MYNIINMFRMCVVVPLCTYQLQQCELLTVIFENRKAATQRRVNIGRLYLAKGVSPGSLPMPTNSGHILGL